MKKLLLLALCLGALAGRAWAQAAPADIVVVRLREGSKVTAVITRGEGKSELVEFENGISDKKLVQTSEGYYKLFKRLYSEGYVLQHTLVSNESPSISDLTLLFVKKP